ncbi:MAG: hypothetical protein IT294_12930 [Deltaproteobacteria bacterium]|nr:hypothetical protein [Deltaproteobacteria bacterium]
MKTVLRSAGIALLATVVGVSIAGAETAKCQRAIAKASAQYLQARMKALSKCNEGVVKAASGTCPDQKATDSIAKSSSKMLASIGKACGGDDKVCGGDLTNEDSPASVDWPAVCPNFEKGTCENAITDCGGIATCLGCIAGAASDQAMTLAFGGINLQNADKTLNKCQVTIGKATTAFLNSASKAFQKCWDARINSKHTGDCFSPNAGDGKYAAAIQKAKDKQTSSICKACGGADKACGGIDDLTVAAIGFPPDCAFVTQPHGGSACSNPISTLTDIVNCTACAARFKADCVDNAQVPQFVPIYPAQCTACAAPPASGPCPTSISFTAEGTKTDLDTGFTGLAHNQTIPSNSALTLAVSGCAGPSEPSCGLCNLSGPLDNVGGPGVDNQRCEDAPWKRCDVDADCTSALACVGGSNNGALCTAGSECPGGACVNAGFSGPCIRFFGGPLPLRPPGGPSTCVMNKINGSVTGTVDFSDGSTTSLVPLASTVHIFGNDFEPCPHCRNDGKCNSGPRAEQACVVSGTSDRFGTVSLDCPPINNVATLNINLNISTGGQTKTVEVGNANCRDTGYGSLKCLCDTCNTLAQEGCSVNGDCPASGGGPGICGGKRCISGLKGGQPCGTCIGGANHGANCNNDSQCPGGACANPRTCVGGANDGAACSTNSACPGGTCPQDECPDTGVCIGGGNDGAACTASSGCPGGYCTPGTCNGGPNDGAGCWTNSMCPGGSCAMGACSRPGEATKPNVCVDDTSTVESGCVLIPGTDNEGECADAPIDQVCSIQQMVGCTTDNDCKAPACAECVPGQFCLTRKRPCFMDQGVIGNTVTVSGTPDPICGGVSKPTVGTFFCVAPTGSTAINAAGGLPALGRVRIPGTVAVNP